MGLRTRRIYCIVISEGAVVQACRVRLAPVTAILSYISVFTILS
jgi:hypothetical protein